MKRLLIGMALLILAVACNKENVSTPEKPVVTRIRTEAGTVTYAKRGTSVEISGENLISVNSVTFNGCEADLRVAVIAQQRILLTIPANAPTIADGPVADEVVVSTDGGEARSSLILLPPAPSLSSMSNTLPEVGETITLTGERFFYVQAVLFPGRRTFKVTEFNVSADGTTIEVTVPEGYDPKKGDIYVSTLSGEASITPDIPEEPEEPEEPLAPLEITELKYVATVNAQEWQVKENLQVGDVVYVDRTSVFVQIPAYYLGFTWISTATNSRAFNTVGATLASFKVNRKTEVYIARNQGNGATIEEWLSDWEAMPRGDNDENYIGVGTDKFWMYKKTFPAGSTVEVGRNGLTNRSPYFIILK